MAEAARCARSACSRRVRRSRPNARFCSESCRNAEECARRRGRRREERHPTPDPTRGDVETAVRSQVAEIAQRAPLSGLQRVHSASAVLLARQIDGQPGRALPTLTRELRETLRALEGGGRPGGAGDPGPPDKFDRFLAELSAPLGDPPPP